MLGEEPRDGLVSHPGGSSNIPTRFLLLKLGQAPNGYATWLECRLGLLSFL